jgi:nucleotide-binding universal stress UspA family protein
MLMGSTADRVLREAPCSVLVVKPHGFTYELE